MRLSKLLLVEDNQEAADLIIAILVHAGHKVIHRTTGIEGLQLVQTEVFDGILLDYMLPDMEGLTLCRMMREVSREVPIILTSAYVNKLTEEDIAAAGITAYVPKPISQNILATINQHVKEQSMAILESKNKPRKGWVKRMLGAMYIDEG